MTSQIAPPEEGPNRILLVEDAGALRASLLRLLTLDGYEVIAVSDGITAMENAVTSSFDLIVLDRVLPYIEGTDVCRRLRELGDVTPILMISARLRVDERVEGLDAGADDYVGKPFAPEELLARVRALLRRKTPPELPSVVSVGDLHLDIPSRRAKRGKRELSLTRTEFDLLELLARNAQIVMTRSLIYERIWGYDFGSESKNLPVYIGYLRHKLEQEGDSRLIHTVRGIGYVMRQDGGTVSTDGHKSLQDASDRGRRYDWRRPPAQDVRMYRKTS